jgi:hypothetical protein
MSAAALPIITAATTAVSAQTLHTYLYYRPTELEMWGINDFDAEGVAEQTAAGYVCLTAAQLGLTDAQLNEYVEASNAFYDFNNGVAVMDDYMTARSDALEIAMGQAEAVIRTAFEAYVAAAAAAAAAGAGAGAPTPDNTTG